MAQHPEGCEICAKIDQIRRSAYPGFISELETGYVILGDSQFFHGYTVFLCKDPAPDLEDLPREKRNKFLTEMALVSEAVSSVIKPHKMNVESLGNVVPHLHIHLFPRQLTEAEPLKPVWLVMPQGEEAQQYALNLERDSDLIQKLQSALKELSS